MWGSIMGRTAKARWNAMAWAARKLYLVCLARVLAIFAESPGGTQTVIHLHMHMVLHVYRIYILAEGFPLFSTLGRRITELSH